MFSSHADEYRRYLAVKLYLEEGKTQAEAARTVGAAQSSVSGWVNEAREHGFEALRTKPRSGRPPQLSKEQMQLILTVLNEFGPEGFGYEEQRWTTLTLSEAIEKLSGIRFSRSRISQLMREHNWSLQKPKRQDKRRDEDKIKQWQEEDGELIKKNSP